MKTAGDEISGREESCSIGVERSPTRARARVERLTSSSKLSLRLRPFRQRRVTLIVASRRGAASPARRTSPIRLIGSASCSLRRSISKPLAASASAMSAVVTEPYSASVSPTLRAMTTSTPASAIGHASRGLPLLGFLGVELGALALDLLLVAVGRQQRELARQQVVARVAVGDLDDLAAASEIVDVFSQNDFHLSASTGMQFQVAALHPRCNLQSRSDIVNPSRTESARSGARA